MTPSPKVASKSVKKISKDVIKTDKKKTRTAKRKESYGIYIYKILIQVHLEFAIHSESISIISRYVFDKLHSLSYLFEFIDPLNITMKYYHATKLYILVYTFNN